jgi:hypothetical protein
VTKKQLFFCPALLLALTFARNGHADAAAPHVDETYALGPGGGEPQQDGGSGQPPLESTGMEDGLGGGCCCSFIGQRGEGGALRFGLLALAGAALVCLRRDR